MFQHLFDSSKKSDGLLSKTAVILVTHASHFLSRVDKILVLSKGNTIFYGNWVQLSNAQPHDQEALSVINSIRFSIQENHQGKKSDSNESKNIEGRMGSIEETKANTSLDDGILMTGKFMHRNF